MLYPAMWELTEYFETTSDHNLRYQVSEMAQTVNEAIEGGQIPALEYLLSVMESAGARTDPAVPEEVRTRNARVLFAVICFAADYPPTHNRTESLNMTDIYSHPALYGKAMLTARKIFERRELDVMRDVFSEAVPGITRN